MEFPGPHLHAIGQNGETEIWILEDEVFHTFNIIVVVVLRCPFTTLQRIQGTLGVFLK